jgi:N-acetylmuramoyl-L-alanine amidase
VRAIIIALLLTTGALANNAPEVLSQKEKHCIVEAIYHEARGESMMCQVILAQSVFNRIIMRGWPNNACAVIKQRSQYSYRTEIKDLTMHDNASKHRAAEALYNAVNMPFDLSNGATHYVRKGTWTYWQDHPNVTFLGQCDNHVFFREER